MIAYSQLPAQMASSKVAEASGAQRCRVHGATGDDPAALLLRSRDDRWPAGVSNSNDLVGRNYMMHNNTHLAAVDPRRKNDVVFEKTFAINDLYDDMGDGYLWLMAWAAVTK